MYTGADERSRTFQEALLSTRRLIFTDSQIYFQCREMYTCESIGQMLSIKDSTWPKPRSTQMGREPFNFTMEAFPPTKNGRRKIYNIIAEYVRRDLSFDSDILNAFYGILHYYWFQEERPTYNAWGLPFPTEDWLFRPQTSSTFSRLFSTALFWVSNKDQPERRPGFPSWTWAGWYDLAPKQTDARFSMYYVEVDGNATFEDLAGNKICVDDYVKRMTAKWNMSQFKPHVYLTGYVTNIHITGNTGTSHAFATVEKDQYFTEAQIFTPSTPETGEDTPLLMDDNLQTVLLLPQSEDTSTNFQGLILEDMGDNTYERRGQVFMFEGCIVYEGEKVYIQTNTYPLRKESTESTKKWQSLLCEKQIIKLV